MERIGSKIRETRTGRNLSQEDIAQATGLKRTYLSRIENGHVIPRIPTLEKLAGAMQVSVSSLLDEEAPHDQTEPQSCSE